MFDKLIPIRFRSDYPPIANKTVGTAAEKFDYDTSLDRAGTVFGLVMNHAEANKERKLNFLDLGGRDGKLKILLGSKNGRYSRDDHTKNKKSFYSRFNYTGCDLSPRSKNVIVGDFCEEDYVEKNSQYRDYFDVIYSNNVFEHLYRPWMTVRHIDAMLRKGGLCAIVVPFAQRYHKSPVDHFRYTHTAIAALFKTEAKSTYRTLVTGYDIHQRRMNVLGHNASALVPDAFGGWRETWYTVTVLQKEGN